jgi:hypothetical protein
MRKLLLTTVTALALVLTIIISYLFIEHERDRRHAQQDQETRTLYDKEQACEERISNCYESINPAWPRHYECKEFPQESGELAMKDNKRRADAARDEMTKEMAACQAAFPGGKNGINAYYSTHK